MTVELTHPEVLRFFNNIQVGRRDECWPVNARRYGVFSVVRDGARVGLSAHRLAWELSNHRAVPDGLQVLHRCDVPRCVNPAHLFIGTQSDNIKDCVAKGRHCGLQKLSTEQIVVAVARAQAGDQYIDIARDLGVSRTLVSDYARGVMKRTAIMWRPFLVVSVISGALKLTPALLSACANRV